MMKKMTLSDLKPIFSDYANWLKDWQTVGKDKLIRVNGPIAQGILLDRLRTGHYRPTNFLQVLTLPKKSGVVLMQHIRRAVDPRNHSRVFDEIKKEAPREVFPPLNQSLDLDSSYSGLVARITSNPAQLVSMASLAAYFGDVPTYKQWKSSFFEELDLRFSSTKDKWIADYGNFLNALDDGLETGTCKSYLDQVIDENMKAEGYA